MAKAKAKKATKKAAKKASRPAAKKPALKAAAKTTKKVAAKGLARATSKKLAKNAISQAASKAATRATAVATARTASSAEAKTASSATPRTVPDLELQATGGQTVRLKDLAGKKVVLYFYPKDMTPGCTIQGHEFTKLKPEFQAENTVVYGISRDSVQLHEKFKAKECYTIDLLSDADEKLCKHFGVIKDKNMYGKMVKGIERSTFVVNEKGEIEKEWRGVKAEGHAQQVLDYLKA